MQRLFKDILSGGRGSPLDFDVECFNQTQPRKYEGLALDQLIERFKTVREETIHIVREMKVEIAAMAVFKMNVLSTTALQARRGTAIVSG